MRGIPDSAGIGSYWDCFNKYFASENLVLPPGCRPYGPEAGPGQRQSAMQ